MTHRELQKAAAASADLFCEVWDFDDDYELGRHDGYEQGFVDGAEWRIDSVSHSPIESPEDGRMYLAIDEDGHPLVGGPNNADFKETARVMRIATWAYIDDLIREERK